MSKEHGGLGKRPVPAHDPYPRTELSEEETVRNNATESAHPGNPFYHDGGGKASRISKRGMKHKRLAPELEGD